MPVAAPASKPDKKSDSAPAPEQKPASPAPEASSSPGVPLFLKSQVQTKLSVNAPGDRFEQEADQMADSVMRKSSASTPDIQRKCSSCESDEKIQTKRAFPEIPPEGKPVEKEKNAKPAGQLEGEKPQTEETPAEGGGPDAKKGKAAAGKVANPDFKQLAEKPDDGPPAIQTKSDNPQGGAPASSGLTEELNASKGGGRPLEAPVKREMESHFGHDLSGVRVHTDGRTPEMNRGLKSRAFTHKNDIYFNSGEYQPDSSDGKRLLAHELTHTVQQGSCGDSIQRFVAPEHEVETEPRPAVPNDGAEVTGRMNQKIADDPDAKDPDDLDEDERKEAENPNRGKVRGESKAISATGENRPSEDRGAAAAEKTSEQKGKIEEQVNAETQEADKEKGEGKDGKKAPLSPAEAASQQADAAQQAAQGIEVPAEPQPFRHPRIEAPVDSAGEDLPRNAQVDTQVRGLGYIGEMFRTKGYEMKHHAAEQEVGSYGLDAVVAREREDLANACEGTAAMETHNESRKEIATQSRDAQAESVSRQEFVAEKAPDLAGKADEGAKDSGDLAQESRSRADESKGKIPDDDDARADAEQQSGEMNETADGAQSMDQAIKQTGERARQYEADAAFAAEKNQEAEARIGETEEVIAQTDGRIAEMQGANVASQAQIEAAAGGPAKIRRFAKQTAKSGDELIAVSIAMEDELGAIQESYLSEMGSIEAKEAALERLQKEQEEASKAKITPEQQTLMELAALSEDEQNARIASLDEGERERLIGELNKMMAETPAAPAAPAEEPGGRIKVDTGLAQAITGEHPPDPRAPQIQEVENRRVQKVGGVLDVADKNMTSLTAEQQRMLANKLVAESITDDIKNINVLQMGKEMLKGLINPRQSLAGVATGFDKMLTGFANIGNWEAWKKDPVGNLLQIAADITTGLATIFSSVLAVAGVITAVMVALTIITWGFAAPVTGPVIAWMGTIMTYAGWGALITGGLAVYFNYLAYIKNLNDAGTADTARELFANTEDMKKNAQDGFQGAMAVVEGVAAVKMGPKLKSGEFMKSVPRSPGQWAKNTVQGAKETLAAVASAPGKLAAGAKRLLTGGKEGLVHFKNRIQSFFKRKPREIDIPETPNSRRAHDVNAGEAGNKKLSEMDGPQRRAEKAELADKDPQRIHEGSEHFGEFDVEVKSNGHTYRRRRDGKGWCRFTAKECFPGEGPIPKKTKNKAEQVDAVDNKVQKQTGEQLAESRGWRKAPDGHEWYMGPDGEPALRNLPGNNKPVLEYNPKTRKFSPKPTSAPKPDVTAIIEKETSLPHKDLTRSQKKRMKQAETERSTWQEKKEKALKKGDEAAASAAHGKMVAASERLGDIATEAAIKKLHPKATALDSDLLTGQKSGQFDKVYKNGDEIIIVESKGAGSQRGSRQTADGIRAEQGTPQYRDDIVKNMQKTVDTHKLSGRYKTDRKFRADVDSLQNTVTDLRKAAAKGKISYVQVSQRVDVHGIVRPEIDVDTFAGVSGGPQ